MSNKHDPRPETEEQAAPGTEPDDEAAVAAELERFRDLAMRTAADFDNYRKRAVREKEDAIRYANTALLSDLMPVLDNFELGMEAARSSADAGSIIQGLDMVARQFRDFLASSGVVEIKAEGEEFDPSFMEAVGHEPDGVTPEGRVLRQTRRGYKLRDRLLRPAGVVVSKGPA